MITRLALILLAVYTGVLGILFLGDLNLAASLFEIRVTDPLPFRQWGASLLMLSLLAILLAGDPVRFRRLIWVALLGLPLDVVVLVYELVSGTSGLRQVGAPLVINVVLFALLAMAYNRERPV